MGALETQVRLLATKVRPSWSSRVVPRLVASLLAVSFLALAMAPLLLPASYSWVENTVSESAGQGVAQGWVVRAGILLTSLSVLILAGVASELWSPLARRAMRFYGFALIGVAFFSDGRWGSVPYDESEAFFHTFCAFWAAIGFAVGVLAISNRRPFVRWPRRLFDLVVVASTALIPFAMLVFLPQAGLLQRFLAVVGYAWLIAEAVTMARTVEALPVES